MIKTQKNLMVHSEPPYCILFSFHLIPLSQQTRRFDDNSNIVINSILSSHLKQRSHSLLWTISSSDSRCKFWMVSMDKDVPKECIFSPTEILCDPYPISRCFSCNLDRQIIWVVFRGLVKWVTLEYGPKNPQDLVIPNLDGSLFNLLTLAFS